MQFLVEPETQVLLGSLCRHWNTRLLKSVGP